MKVWAIRFIPTGVGNTQADANTEENYAVHPHGRGEHAVLEKACPCPYGSSPRAWGTLSTSATLWPEARFIPTGVGNTTSHLWLLQRSTVHPHGRGEHTYFYFIMGIMAGSSPRAWGTRSRCPLAWVCVSVHPHGRGEHGAGTINIAEVDGSSPRAWGTLLAYSTVIYEENYPRKLYQIFKERPLV